MSTTEPRIVHYADDKREDGTVTLCGSGTGHVCWKWDRVTCDDCLHLRPKLVVDEPPVRHAALRAGGRVCGDDTGDAAFGEQYVNCPRCREILSAEDEGVRLPTAKDRAAVDSAERIGEAVVRIADAVRLVLPIITGAVVDIRAELKR